MGSSPAAVVGRRSGRHAAVVAVVVPDRPAPQPGGSPRRTLADGVRVGGRRRLRRRARGRAPAPRHPPRLQDRPPRSPAGPPGSSPASGRDAAREGPRHRRHRAARAAPSPSASLPAATTSPCCSAGRPGCDCGRCSATSPTPTPSAAAVRGQDARRAPGGQGRRRRAAGPTTCAANVGGTERPRRLRARGRAPAGPGVLAVRGPRRRAACRRRRRPGRPGAAPAATTRAPRPRPSCSPSPPTRPTLAVRRRPPPPRVGPGRHPARRADRGARARAGRLPGSAPARR